MADGFEAARSENYFNGGMKDQPVPKKIRRRKHTGGSDGKKKAE